MELLSEQPAWSQCTALMPGVGNCSCGTSRYSDGMLYPGCQPWMVAVRTRGTVAPVPCRVPSGGTALEQGAGMGQVRQGPVFWAACMLGSSTLALHQSCSGALGTAPLKSLGKGSIGFFFFCPGWASRGSAKPPEPGGDLSLSVSSSACEDPCLRRGGTGEPCQAAEHPVSLEVAAGQPLAQPHQHCPANRGVQPWGGQG